MSNFMKRIKYGIRIIGAVIGTSVFAFMLFWGINEITGVFTYMHLDHERQIAQHIYDPKLTQERLDELTDDADSMFMWKRRIAAIELGKLGTKAQSALPVLEKLLQDKDAKVRAVAKEAVDKIQNDVEG